MQGDRELCCQAPRNSRGAFVTVFRVTVFQKFQTAQPHPRKFTSVLYLTHTSSPWVFPKRDPDPKVPTQCASLLLLCLKLPTHYSQVLRGVRVTVQKFYQHMPRSAAPPPFHYPRCLHHPQCGLIYVPSCIRRHCATDFTLNPAGRKTSRESSG